MASKSEGKVAGAARQPVIFFFLAQMKVTQEKGTV